MRPRRFFFGKCQEHGQSCGAVPDHGSDRARSGLHSSRGHSSIKGYSPQESDRSRNSGRRFSCKKRKDCWNDGWSAGGRTGILYGSDCFRRVTPPPPCLFRFWYGNLDRYFIFFRRETRPAFQLVCTCRTWYGKLQSYF